MIRVILGFLLVWVGVSGIIHFITHAPGEQKKIARKTIMAGLFSALVSVVAVVFFVAAF